MGIGNVLVVSSAVDDERVRGARNALGRLLILFGDFSSADDILTLTAAVGVRGDAMNVSPGPARRQAEAGDQWVNSSAERVDVVVGIVLLKNSDGTNEVLAESAEEVDNQSILTNDLTGESISFVLGGASWDTNSKI